MAEAGLAPGPNPSPLAPDEWIKRVGGLPLMHQPGERWMYHTGSDILGVLLARVLQIPRLMTSPTAGDINADSWMLAYQAIDD
jgi:hypothetical protein